MKKIISSFIALLMAFSFSFIYVSANSEEIVANVETSVVVETNVKHIMAEDNLVLEDGSYIVNSNSLVGTDMEGKVVIVKDNGVYVNGSILDDILIYVADKLVAHYIDGVILYVTGYTGSQLAAASVAAIVALVAAHPAGFFLLLALAAFTAAVIMSYKTTSGNECVLNPSGHGYTCMYSL